MNEKYFIGKKVSSFEAYHPEDPITGVRLTVDQSNAYFAGDMDGNVWEMHCPYGTQQMANNILASLRGQVYKGFEAQDAILAPEAELGDGITVNGLYTSLGYRKVEFGPGHFSTVSAPGNNEQDVEFKYLPQRDHDEQYSRADTYSYIEKTSEEIKLGVKNDLDGLSAELKLDISNLSAHFEDSQKQQTADFQAGLDGLKFNLEDQLKQQSVSFEADLKGIRTRVTDAEGDISSLEQTAKSLRSDLTSAEGDISSLEQTAKSLRSDITSAQGDISSLEQTATSITSMVTQSAGTVGDDLVEFIKLVYSYNTSGGTDRQIDAWFYSGAPSGARQPESSWTSTMKSAHEYDLYYDTTNDKLYFYYMATSTIGAWVEFDNFALRTSMKKASKSHDTTSDNLRRVFLSTPTPPYSVGDLWRQNSTTFKRCKTDKSNYQSYSSLDWEDAKDYMDSGYFSESKIEQIASGITLSVTNGTTGSSIKLTAGDVTITSNQINFSGVVTFINSGYNSTTINGGKITANSITSTQIATGTITANEIQSGTITADKLAANAIVAGSIKGSSVGLIDDNSNTIGNLGITYTVGGYGLEFTTYYGGIRMNPAGFFWVDSDGGNFGTTYSGFQITADCVPTRSSTYSLGAGGLLWSAVYASTGAIQSSDERYKNGIDAIPDKYVAMLDKVEPVIYKLNDGTSGRYHAGFISQQVKEAMDEAGVDSTEFGGFVIAKDGEGNDFYMLRYEEFIAPMLAKMRQLEQRIKVLEGT